uniref:Hint (Hedgehog/Intein) domain N-terminal region n=1 Tax=Myoviridae sp. ctbEa13 TaxID=2825136 RepID=A0A8S5VBL2_9CAUD|nr:MAG TPA: Hint (Hedgehog/Intein) domain N-terminal region [Myoviridae sp. ctbEa13]
MYDGSDANGTLLTTINENPSVGEVGTFSIKSGSLYIQARSYIGAVGAWYRVDVNNETGDTIASTTKTEVVPISSNVVIEFVEQYCLTGDTLITLADGSSKRIDQLTLADKVLSYNPETLQLEPDEITYTDSTEHKTHTEYKIYTFADGTTVKTVHRHRFYNVERQAMVYLDEWKLGEHAVNIHGETIALANEITCKTEIQHYTIFTKNQNYFANGLLSGNRYTKPLTL